MKKLLARLLTFVVCVGSVVSGSGSMAEELSYPYQQTFTISAYYSPLPCQNRYTTGSYEGDIRLNGRGTNGADGTEVYPGMVAAPKTYAFGTKLYIPGIGNVAVHDRGGAIVTAGNRGQVYDRLDIWMGYGDIGLTRALNWGKRDVNVTVYGKDPNIAENITGFVLSPNEHVPQECQVEEVPAANDEVKLAVADVESGVSEISADEISRFSQGLSRGSSGEQVKALQRELTSLNFYRGEINGSFDATTEHAVFKFQQSQGIVATNTELGAGVFGPKTRDRVNEILASREYTTALVAEATLEKQKEEESTVAAF